MANMEQSNNTRELDVMTFDKSETGAYRKRNKVIKNVFSNEETTSKPKPSEALVELAKFEMQELQETTDRLEAQKKRARQKMTIKRATEKRRNEVSKKIGFAILGIAIIFGAVKTPKAVTNAIDSYKEAQAFDTIDAEAREVVEKNTRTEHSISLKQHIIMYSIEDIANEINTRFKYDEQYGKMFLAAINRNITINRQKNMDEIIRYVHNPFDERIEDFLSYVQALGYSSIDEFERQMLKENYQLAQQEEGITR